MNESNWSRWAKAFTIFAKYAGKEYAHTAAEHDEVYAGPEPEKVSEEDKKLLNELGWTECSEFNCFHKFT